jgi:hypothetical protein
MRQLGVVPFGKLLMLWDLPCWFLDYFDWRTLVNVPFLSVLFLRWLLSQIDKKPIMNPKIGEPVMQSLTEGIKFVFNNKTVLDITLIW